MAIKISGTTVIDDSRNITNVGSVGDSNTVYYGDGSGLSGIQAGSSTFTASGAISNGEAVLVNTDGTVSAPTASIADPPNLSDAIQIDGTNNNHISGVDIGNGKFVFAYAASDRTWDGEAVVATMSSSSISFGNPTTFETQSIYTYLEAIYDSANDKVVIAYQDSDNSSRGTAIVGDVSGDSITFGSAVVFETGNTQDISLAYDSNNNKVVIAYQDNSGSQYGRAVVGTVSGTSISFGTIVAFHSASTGVTGATFDSNSNKVVIGYNDAGNFGRGKALVGTVSGTSISFGTEVVFESGDCDAISATFDSTNDKVIIAYRDTGNANRGTVVVGTVSGTSISFGTPTVFNGENSLDVNAAYDSTNDRTIIGYRDAGDSFKGTVKILDIQTTDISSDNFIGIAAEAISNAATGSITMVTGINASQSSLTPGQQYYVQKDGSLSTTADTPSLLAGTAISSTQIIVKR